jgi:serine/threonine protein kinase
MADLPELPLVGDEFAGYRLRAVLGRGGMSVVYQAENPRLGSVIALKVPVRFGFAGSPMNM